MNINQISTAVKARIAPGDTIQVQRRSSDDYKFMGWKPVNVVAVYDRFTLTERNGYRECYNNLYILKCLEAVPIE
jgi:hypothetical protein